MLQEIKTKFGSIYMEQLGEQEEKERIKIYDSLQRYLTYIGVYLFEEIAKDSGTTAESILRDWCKNLINYKTIQELIDVLIGSECELITTNWNEAVNVAFDNPDPKDYFKLTIFEADYINKIGDYYIVISEWR